MSRVIATILITAALASANPSAPDTVLVDDLVVLGAPDGAADPADVTLSAAALTAAAPWNAGDLEPLLPATSVNVNSRGESLLMIRGAPERHVTVMLDGIPLAVPWDERTDLSLVPLDGVASLRATRGAASLLGGPNGVAGSLELRTDGHAPAASASIQVADGADYAGRASLSTSRGAWDWLAAASVRDRDALLLPDGLVAPYHQLHPEKRANTDLRQASALLRGVRWLDDGGRFSVLLLGSDAEKGVAPETHLDDGARLWRLPLVRRGLAGVRLERPLGSRWELDASAAVDAFAQDIQEYDDDAYMEADGLEQGRDLTAHLALGLHRDLDGLSSLDLSLRGRATRHRETLPDLASEHDYSQRLVSAVAEWHVVPDAPWTLRLGLGVDAAATPSSGDKPARDAMTAPALLARLTHDVGHGAQAHLAVSRRSRFPALRELYSGALGRFVPNPDLDPERQTLAETGLAARGNGWEAGLTAFIARLDDGIEKSSLGDGRFTRLNRTRIDTRGLELVLSKRLGRGLSLGLHHALLHAAVDNGDAPDRPAEDRPAHQGALMAEWRTPAGWHASVVGRWIGRRASADASDAGDGLMALDSSAWWDVWFGRSFDRGPNAAIEARVGVRNAGDAVVWEQAGLPGAGRTYVVSVGWTLY